MTMDIDDLIARSGLTPAETALLCGVSMRTVRRWRTGENAVPMSTVVLLELLAKHGLSLAGASELAVLDDWLGEIVRRMAGAGLSSVQRRLGCGYGVAARLMERQRLRFLAALRTPPLVSL